MTNVLVFKTSNNQAVRLYFNTRDGHDQWLHVHHGTLNDGKFLVRESDLVSILENPELTGLYNPDTGVWDLEIVNNLVNPCGHAPASSAAPLFNLSSWDRSDLINAHVTTNKFLKLVNLLLARRVIPDENFLVGELLLALEAELLDRIPKIKISDEEAAKARLIDWNLR